MLLTTSERKIDVSLSNVIQINMCEELDIRLDWMWSFALLFFNKFIFIYLSI